MTTPDARPMLSRWRALRPLRHRDYRLLIAAVGLSIFATGMWTIVMIFQVLALDDSPAALSLVAASLSGGLFAFAIVGGVAADRLSRRKIIVTVQLVNTVATAAVAALALIGTIQLWHLVIASATLGAGSAFFFPAYSAYLPQVLPADELLAANGLEGALRPTMQQGLGPALGGAIVGMFLPGTGALVVAILFGLAFVLTLFVGVTHDADVEATDEVNRPSVFTDLRDGVGFVLRTPWLLWTLLSASLMLLVIMGPIEVLLPFAVRDLFDDSEQMFGLLLATYGIGGAIGSLATSSWRLPRRYLTVMVMCWGAGSLPIALIGYTSSFWIMAGALFIVGFANGAGMVIWGTLLQRRVPPKLLGRVASLDFFISIAFMPLSMVLAGLLAEAVPIPVLFLAAGVVPFFLGVIAVLAGRMPQDELAHPLEAPSEAGDEIPTGAVTRSPSGQE